MTIHSGLLPDSMKDSISFKRFDKRFSFVSDDDAEGQKESLGDDTWSRLAGIKAKVDPDNVFARNPNQRPAAVPA